MKFRALAGLGVHLASGTAAWAQQYLISTFAGGATPPTPIAAVNAPIGRASAVATDATGNVYFISDNCVFKLEQQNGVLTRVAGNSRVGYSGDGASAINARLSDPRGVAVDGAGNLFIADSGNYRIRKVSFDGIISTVAGNGSQGFSGDGGPATSAPLLGPQGVAVDGDGNLFIADTMAYTFSLSIRYNSRIRKVSANGIITTVAGNGTYGFSGDGGRAIIAQLLGAQGVAIDSAGIIFIADVVRIRKVSPDGIIRTVAGNGSGYSGDGGPAINAGLSAFGVAVDGGGNLFILDKYNYRIRKVSADGIIRTVAGNGSFSCSYSGDGGPATGAQLCASAVAVDSAGNLFISVDNRIRKVAADGIITTVAGGGSPGYSGDGGPAINAQLGNAREGALTFGVAVDGEGNLFIADTSNNRVRKVSSSGIITTVAGNGSPGYSGDGGPAINAQLSGPNSVAVDSAGNLLILDFYNNRIRKVSSSGTITTVSINVELNHPQGIAVDSAGNLFIANTYNLRILKVSSDGIITTVAGNGTYGFSGDGGPAINARLSLPDGVAVDGAGNVYFADPTNHAIRRLQPVVSSPTYPFTVTDRGGTSLMSAGIPASISVGYARVQGDAGSTTPSGLAIFGFRQNNILVSETGVPASLPLTSGRIYAEVAGPVNTGLAIANPNNSIATIHFFFTDTAGNDLGSGSTTIGPNGQLAKFLDQAPFNGPPSFQGTFSFTSDVPVGVIALRGLTNERSEFLMSTLPVIDTTSPPGLGAVVVPHFADGGGWVTQIFLVNPTDNPMTGKVQFTNPDGAAAKVTIEGQTDSTFGYTVAGRSSQKLRTAGATLTRTSGSVRIVPNGDGPAPTPLVLFSYKPAMITVSEAGVPVTSGTAFRMYVESSVESNIQSGIAVANTSSSPATVTFELTTLSGAPAGVSPVTLNLPGSGQAARFLGDIFPSLGSSFRGVLRITMTSSGLSVVGLRTRVNERGDFLITTTPPTVESNPASKREWLFPVLADGGGCTTQFILFSGTAGQSSSGTLRFVDQSGQSSTLTVY